jgi:hypothetical protein
LKVFGGGHNFEDVKGGPGHVVTEHFEVDKLQESSGLQVCMFLSVLPSSHVPGSLTHVLPSDLCATFFQTVLDILFLVPLVVAQTSNEVIQGLFEPATQSEGKLFGARERIAHILELLSNESAVRVGKQVIGFLQMR